MTIITLANSKSIVPPFYILLINFFGIFLKVSKKYPTSYPQTIFLSGFLPAMIKNGACIEWSYWPWVTNTRSASFGHYALSSSGQSGLSIHISIYMHLITSSLSLNYILNPAWPYHWRSTWPFIGTSTNGKASNFAFRTLAALT